MALPTFDRMKLLVEVKDSKAAFVTELLANLSFVKVKPVQGHKEKVLNDLREAIEELKLVKKGKLKVRTLQEFLDEI